MSRTTEQWEALLTGTTEGPWEAREDHGGMEITIPDDQLEDVALAPLAHARGRA